MEFDGDAQLGGGGLVAVYIRSTVLEQCFRVPHDTPARDVAGIGGPGEGVMHQQHPTALHHYVNQTASWAKSISTFFHINQVSAL